MRYERSYTRRRTGAGMRAERWLRYIGAVIIGLVTPEIGNAQYIGPVTFRDSLVLRQVAFRAPCPSPVPAAWTVIDSTLGRGLRCSLVEAAARALAEGPRDAPSFRGRADPWSPLCVRILVTSSTGSTGLPGDWLVVFDLAADLPAYVIIDRQTAETVVAMVGRTPPGGVRCVFEGTEAAG